MPRLCSQLRSAPVTTASTTSLTVPPSASLIRLKVGQLRARPDEAPVRADLGVQRHVGRRVGEGPGDLAERPPAPRRPGAPSVSGSRTALDRALGELERARGQRRRAPRATSSAVDGSGCGTQSSSGSIGSGTGLRSKRTVPMSTPETPSTSAWWVLVSGSRSGRARGPGPATAPRAASSGRAAARRRGPASCLSCSSPPGVGQRGVADVVGRG